MLRRLVALSILLVLAATGAASAAPVDADCRPTVDPPTVTCEVGTKLPPTHLDGVLAEHGIAGDVDHDGHYEVGGADLKPVKTDAVETAARVFPTTTSSGDSGTGIDVARIGRETVYLAGDRVMDEDKTVDCLGPRETWRYTDQVTDSANAVFGRATYEFHFGGPAGIPFAVWETGCGAAERIAGHGLVHDAGASPIHREPAAPGIGYPSTGSRLGTEAALGTGAASTNADDGAAAVPGHDLLPEWNVLLGVALLAFLAGGLLPLLRRVQGEDLLDHDLRQQLLEVVRGQPAANASELAEALDVDVTTVLYHARRMADADLLVLKRFNGEVVFFDPATHPKAIRDVAATLRHDTKRRLLGLVAREPGLNLSELARRLDRAPSTVKRHADTLIETGLVRSVEDGGARRLDVADGVRETLDRLAR